MKENKKFFSYRLFMSTDKAKESAAIAAVNEQINNVGRKKSGSRDPMGSTFSPLKKTLEK
jgi:hypothetical protein